jgi:transcriptional regulator with XRE-family HTH domain
LFDENGVFELEQPDPAQGGFEEWTMDRPIDVTALYVALDARRSRLKMSWRDLAKQLGLSSSIFTRLAQGRAPELSSYRKMTGWLGVGMDDFAEGDKPTVEQSEDTVETIAAYLRADKALKPESAQAIETIVRAAYEEMADRR